MKIDVSVACSTLGQIVQSASTFHIHMGNLKTKIVQFNAQLAGLHHFINLPFTVVLTVEDRMAFRELEEYKQVADPLAMCEVPVD
jgi:stringent starvation protein B